MRVSTAGLALVLMLMLLIMMVVMMTTTTMMMMVVMVMKTSQDHLAQERRPTGLPCFVVEPKGTGGSRKRASLKV